MIGSSAVEGWGGGISRIQLRHTFEEVISLENLCAAWEEFVAGKRKKPDVQEFSQSLMDHIVSLHEDLAQKRYAHGGYEHFRICDPKPRHIHKASVRDRLLHHAIYRMLYPFFDRTFIADSFSCRVGKGVHKALNRFRAMAYRVSRNHTRTCWILKCDVQKFFASIDHAVLLQMLRAYIPNADLMWLLGQVVSSFSTEGRPRVGLPLGNLTSQLFANVYLNALDQFVKHRLHARQYIRYADDFAILSRDREWLVSQIPLLQAFLRDQLRLILHPQKISINTFFSGVDFLGWVHFSDHRVLRNATRRRMMRRVQAHATQETLQSYVGLLSHGNAFTLAQEVRMAQWLGH